MVNRTSAVLREVPLFAELPPADFQRCTEIAMARTFKRDEVIFRNDDPGSALFILTSGTVKVCIEDREGREAILKILYPYDFFGEMALLDGLPRSATVKAVEPCQVLVLQRDDFLQLIRDAPQIAMKMLAILSRRLRRTDERIASLVFSDAYGKVARMLLDLAAEKGTKTAHGIAIDAKLTRSELANLSGVSRETLTRILHEFERSGCLKTERQKILILNETVLKRETV